MTKKYFITGACGFIGSNLAEHILNTEKEAEIYVIDDLSMGSIENLPDDARIFFTKGSVTDRSLMEQMLSSHQFDYIFHLAAVASVADSVARPVETHQVNFESVLLLLELVRTYQKQLKRLVFSSSAAVYGDEPTVPKKEESVIRPLTPYAVDKFAAERFVLNYAHLYHVPTSAVRFFNVYGPKQNPKSPYSGVISILMDRYAQLKEGKKVHFNLFGDGCQSRDFVFVKDVIQALLLVSKGESSIGEVYNVGTGKETTLNDLIHNLNELLHVTLPVSYQQSREGDILTSVANISKLTSLGYHATYSIFEGLKEYITYQKM